jgi:hypothetical protein
MEIKLNLSLCLVTVMNPGSAHLPAQSAFGAMFDKSIVSVEGIDHLQRVELDQCSALWRRRVAKPVVVVHVYHLSVKGWQLYLGYCKV